MIYWFTGKFGVGKTIQGNKLKEFLQTEKRNWRRDVFHIDDKDLNSVEMGDVDDVTKTQIISKFLNTKGCDVVVSINSPNREQREIFKKVCKENIVEIYIHNTRKKVKEENKNIDFQEPTEDYFDLDTTSENPIQSFNKVIHFLKNKGCI
jgi:adenylylsulfate kinase-like enzyme